MEYWKIVFEDDCILVESDIKNRTVYRQIVINDKKSLSAFEDCLVEGDFYIDDMEGTIEKLSEAEFDKMWYLEINKYKREWEEVKSKYVIGSIIEVETLYSYPWGWIVKIRDSYIVKGLMKSKESHYSNEKIECIITGYDEKNLWIIMDFIKWN